MQTTSSPEATALPIPEKESYTYADYAQLPEGAPYELIVGDLNRVPTSSIRHQRILLRLAVSMQHHIDQENNGEVFIAPMDVYLSEATTVQPDVLYIAEARREIIGAQRINGAPDVVAEIFSPSTGHRDVGIKKRLYEQHGVREYWTIDPETQAVEVHVNTDTGFQQRARVVETGVVASAVMEGFNLDIATLF